MSVKKESLVPNNAHPSRASTAETQFHDERRRFDVLVHGQTNDENYFIIPSKYFSLSSSSLRQIYLKKTAIVKKEEGDPLTKGRHFPSKRIRRQLHRQWHCHLKFLLLPQFMQLGNPSSSEGS